MRPWSTRSASTSAAPASRAPPSTSTRGEFAAERVRIDTPSRPRPRPSRRCSPSCSGSSPTATARSGVTVPGVVRHGVVHSAANIDKSWIGTDADALFTEATGRDVHVVNDADAAGLAEVRYGAARAARAWSSSPRSAPASARRWCTTACWCRTPSSATSRSTATTPRPARPTAPARARTCRWEQWAERLTTYYRTLEKLFSPDLFVVGGGVSKHVRAVPAAARHRHRDRARHAAQQGRRRRRRALRQRGRRLSLDRARTPRSRRAGSARRPPAPRRERPVEPGERDEHRQQVREHLARGRIGVSSTVGPAPVLLVRVPDDVTVRDQPVDDARSPPRS